jgi:hypothetical protein
MLLNRIASFSDGRLQASAPLNQHTMSCLSGRPPSWVLRSYGSRGHRISAASSSGYRCLAGRGLGTSCLDMAFGVTTPARFAVDDRPSALPMRFQSRGLVQRSSKSWLAPVGSDVGGRLRSLVASDA